MAKVTREYTGEIRIIHSLDCGHPFFIKHYKKQPKEGDEVDCQVCSKIEKRVKEARVKELVKVICIMVDGKTLKNPYHKRRLDSVREHFAYREATDVILDLLNERIAELEKA